MHRIFLTGCLMGCLGCAGTQAVTRNTAIPDAALSTTIRKDLQRNELGVPAVEKTVCRDASNAEAALHGVSAASHVARLEVGDVGDPKSANTFSGDSSHMMRAVHSPADSEPAGTDAQSESVGSGKVIVLSTAYTAAGDQPAKLVGLARQTEVIPVQIGAGQGGEVPSTPLGQVDNAMPLNLPSALAMVDGRHPAVGFARWRVQEAYAQLANAKVLWLPSLRAGFSFHRHDGNYQASDGNIIDVDRNSFQYGLGIGATGAGTTLLPGLIARFHLADAIFQPKIAEKTAWARGHAASAVVNQQLLTAAGAYLDLLAAYQEESILGQSRDRTSQLAKITADFAAAGEGLQADADRLQTELVLVEDELLVAGEAAAVASARLAQAISLDAGCRIVPTDLTALPLNMVAMSADECSLIGIGLTTRPELKESQALVAAAQEAFRRQKYAPFVPSTLLGFSTSGFGGGLGNNLSNVDDRLDFDALMSWEVRNLGFGERSMRRESAARVQQAKFEKVRVMDQVAREVSEAYSQVQFRAQRISTLERAIQSARDSYDRNLERIRDGQGLPLEVLQSAQALETAQLAYLRAVIDHNQAQFRLQWALGWPVTDISGEPS